MSYQSIKDIINLPRGTQVQNIIGQIKTIEKRKTQTGDPYYFAILADKEASIEGRIWSDAFSYIPIDKLHEGVVVLAHGSINTYNNIPQFIINKIRIPEASEYDDSLLFPLTKKDIDKLWLQLLDYINQIENLKLRNTLKSLFTSIEVEPLFKIAAGSRIVHHVYKGGLLEHTIEVVEIALSIYKHYETVSNKDVIIAGALLHDVGKIFEYNPDTYETTIDGYLIGHIVLGMELFNKFWASTKNPIKDSIQEQVVHIILAHHTELEYGAVVRPATIEAAIVAQADLASSTVKQFAQDLIKVDPKTKMAPYNKYIRTKVTKLTP